MKQKWWLILCLTSSFVLSGCGSDSPTNAAGAAPHGTPPPGSATSYFATPANLQPIENALAQVGIRFIPTPTNVNGQQGTAPGLDTQFFAAYYPGRLAAQGLESNYVGMVQNTLANPALDQQTFFTLSVKMNIVQGLTTLSY